LASSDTFTNDPPQKITLSGWLGFISVVMITSTNLKNYHKTYVFVHQVVSLLVPVGTQPS
jgi:hypothetical protein